MLHINIEYTSPHHVIAATIVSLTHKISLGAKNIWKKGNSLHPHVFHFVKD